MLRGKKLITCLRPRPVIFFQKKTAGKANGSQGVIFVKKKFLAVIGIGTGMTAGV
jgi:hypothetical protein